MSGFGDFEAEDHIVLLEVLLARDLHLLELAKVGLARPVGRLQEASALLHGG